MPFTPEQFQAVFQALNAKIAQPCPSCAQNLKRQVVQELVLMGGYTRKPLDPNAPIPTLPQGPLMPSPLLVSFLMPCVMTICTNCGFLETYSVHTLGIAAILGVPPAGSPMG